MLIVQTTNAVAAWRQTLVRLSHEGSETDNQKYWRDEVVLIELTSPTIEPADSLFPMAQEDLDVINRFICSGDNETKVIHEWTKLYFHRMFDEPHSQIKYLLKTLESSEPVGRAQISFWDKSIDQNQSIVPCTQIVWARKKHNKLELHVHARASDAYSKLLMNLQEFIALQQYIARSLGVEMGKYYHFLDSCHIHRDDLRRCELVVQKLAIENESLPA